MDGANPAEIGLTPPGVEINRSPETRLTREQVQQAVKEAVDLLKATPEDNLTKHQKWQKKLFEEAEGRINSNEGDGTAEVTFQEKLDNQNVTQNEGLPVDELIRFVLAKARELPKDSVDRYKLLQTAKILHKSSQKYVKRHSLAPNKFEGRVRHEAYLISEDERATGNQVGDYLEATRDITRRRELVLPEPESSDARTPEPRPTPEDDEPDVTLTPTTVDRIRREVVIINRNVDIEKRAREMAEEQLRNEMKRGSALNPLNWFRKIQLRVGEEYYRQLYIQRAREAMITNNNSYLNMDLVRNAAVDANKGRTEAQQAGQAKIEQVKLGETAEQRLQATGPLKDLILSDVIRPLITRLQNNENLTDQDVQRLLRTFVQANENHASQQVRDGLQEMFGRGATQFGRLAEYFATDMLEIAKVIKADVDTHTSALKGFDEAFNEFKDNIDITLANTSWAAETEANFNLADRIIAWTESGNRRGWLLNPATIGVAASLAALGLQKLPGGLGRAAGVIPAPIVGAVAGAGFAALRRNMDLKRDMSAHRVDRAYNRQIADGSSRREALEDFAYDTRSVSDLLSGRENAPNESPHSIGLRDLLTRDLSDGQDQNRHEVIQRMAEIKARLDFSSNERIDLVTFSGKEQVEQGRLELLKAVVEARKALQSQGMNQAEIARLENHYIGQWNGRFIRNREQQDRRFGIYRLRNAAGAAAFAGVAGLTGGLLGQEALAQIGRNVEGLDNVPVIGSLFRTGETELERRLNQIGAGGVAEWMGNPNRSALSAENLRALFDNPQNLKLPDGYQLAIDPQTLNPAERAFGRSVKLLASDGAIIDMPPTKLTPDGHIVTAGKPDVLDKLPASVRQLFSGWEVRSTVDPTKNLHERIKDVLANNKDEIFQYGRTVLHIKDGQMSIDFQTDTGDFVRVHGFARLDSGNPVLDFDSTFAENPNITPAMWQQLNAAIAKEGWGVNVTQIPGKTETVNLMDEFFKKTPEQMKALGVMETTSLAHTNEYDVLRPDVVKKTGLHTHNELTFHASGFRNYPGEPGVLSATGQIRGGSIPSWGVNYPGFGVLPAAEDPALNQINTILDKVSGKKLEWKDLVYIVRTSDNREIILPMGPDSKVKLPQEFWRVLPDGSVEYRGIDRMGYGVLQTAANGPIIPANEVLNNPNLLKNGSFVERWLASEAFGGKPSTGTVETPPVNVFKLTPPEAVELIPPPAQESAPFIPIPFAPRHPLEPLEPTAIIYDMYSNRIPEDRIRAIEQNRSESLREDPNAVLNPLTEAQSYFDRQNPSYVREVRNLASQISQPPSENLRAVVCIPVAGHQEGGNIYNSLMNYVPQDAPRDQFEIVVFVNYPEKDRDGNPITPDNTMQEIQRFMREHPEMPVRVMSSVLRPEQANIGTIRKMLNDAVLYRQMQRGESGGDLIMISNDADNKGVAPEYLSNFIQEFDSKPNVDGMLGQLDWDPEAYTKYPIIHIGTRLFQYLNTIGRNRSGRMPSSGANFAFRGSIYAAIGGYLTNTPGGEDIAIGQAITLGRGNVNRIQYAGARVSRVYTSARRAIDSLNNGLAPIEQWQRGFSAFDDEIRRLQLGGEEEINYDDPEQLNRLREGLELVINRTLDTYESGERIGKGAAFYKRALRYLGVNYEVVDGQVSITNMDTLVRGLKQYQKVGVLLRDIKSGKETPENTAELKRLQDEFFAELGDLDAEAEREAEEINNAVDEKLTTFETDDIKLPDAPPLRYDLAELQASADKQEEGDFVICRDKPVGTGGMGTVFAGYNKVTGELLAFKQTRRDEQEFIARANNYPTGVTDAEDLIVTQVNNPHLNRYTAKIDNPDGDIKVYELGSSDLNNYIEGNKSLDPELAVGLTIQIVSALRSLHQGGIVHLDLSPTNILIDKEGKVKLTDFGAASINTGTGFKRGFQGGYRNILPPELFEEGARVDHNADTYEASILLYRLLTGDYPYKVPSGLSETEKTERLKAAHQAGVLDIPDTLPEPVKEILRKGIQPNPTNRYNTANDMLNDLLSAYQTLKGASTTTP